MALFEDILNVGTFGLWNEITKPGDPVKQKPLETPEQTEARKRLLEFSKTGELNTSSGLYPGSFGNYSLTPVEKMGESKLYEYLNSASPELFQIGSDNLKGLLSSDKFDPYSPTGTYAGFKSDVERNLRESTDRVKRESAFSKNLYSTDTIDRIGDLEEQGQNQLTSKLAELYDTYTQRKLSAIPLAFQGANQLETSNANKIGAAYQYGSLPRMLDIAGSQAIYNDWLRSRTEQLNSLNSVASSNANFGVESIPTPNKWLELIKVAAEIGGKFIGKG
jgi:hypothetical protein